MRQVSVKTNIKTGGAILCYSILLSVLLIIAFYIIGLNVFVERPSTMPQIIFVPSASEIENAYITKSITVNVTEAVSFSDISHYYNQQYLSFFPIIVVIMSILIFIASLFLYLLLRKIQNKNIISITNKLNLVEQDENGRYLDPLLSNAVENIKLKVETNVEDFKRLSSYINHEQKNILQLLRTKIEIIGEKSLLPTIDELASSIDDVLTIGAMTTELQTIDAKLVCANACDTYRKIYKSIEFSFDETAKTTIKGNELWLYRSLSNLLDNAIKYGNGSKIKVDVSATKGSVTICVSDGGKGIEDTYIDNIFDNRYRVNMLNKNGYGLGLSLVQHVCDICGGIGIVESNKNGTVFSLAFPLAID